MSTENKKLDKNKKTEEKWAELNPEYREWSTADDFMPLLLKDEPPADPDSITYYRVKYRQLTGAVSASGKVDLYYLIHARVEKKLILAREISYVCNKLKAKEVAVAELDRDDIPDGVIPMWPS